MSTSASADYLRSDDQPTVAEATVTKHYCGHRNVTGIFDESGRHLSNRCDDCGYTVNWTAADTGDPVPVDTAALNRVMDLGVTARLRDAGYPDVRIHAVEGRPHGWEVFCYSCSDVVGLVDTEEEALRERGAHLDEAHNAGRAR